MYQCAHHRVQSTDDGQHDGLDVEGRYQTDDGLQHDGQTAQDDGHPGDVDSAPPPGCQWMAAPRRGAMWP